MKMIRLDNGDWIDPKTVQRIKPLPMVMDATGFQPPMVMVVYSTREGHVGFSVIELAKDDDIQGYADNLAARINEIRT